MSRLTKLRNAISLVTNKINPETIPEKEKPEIEKPFFGMSIQAEDEKYISIRENLIAWIDIMGFSSMLHRSIATAANFMGKLHVAAIDELSEFRKDKPNQTEIRLYPVMDGIYITCDAKNVHDFGTFLASLMARLSLLFLETKDIKHLFIVKGSIAKGPTLHGRDITMQHSPILANKENKTYRESLLVSYAMADSNKHEPKAPPFGFFVHDTARDFLDKITNNNTIASSYWWYWFEYVREPKERSQNIIAPAMRTVLHSYFERAAIIGEAIGYSAESIRKHKSQMEAYFYVPSSDSAKDTSK